MLCSALVMAQTVDNVTESNCDNSASETLYDFLDQGKVVLIAADGFDCSICRSHAPSMGTFATDNPDIKVWGAMHFKYRSTLPTCNDIDSWDNSYSWANIFMFVDEDRSWAGSGYPTYTVIDPKDKSIAYRGPSDTQAKNTAKALSNTTGISENNNGSNDLQASYLNGELHLSFVPGAQLEIMQLNGQVIELIEMQQSRENISLSLDPGIYLVVSRDAKNPKAAKLFVRE